MTPYEQAVLLADQSPTGCVKKCRKCGVVKPTNQFHTDNRKLDKLRIYCIECMKLAKLAYRAIFGQSERLSNHYSMTIAQYREKIDVQGGLCPICGKPLADNMNENDVDHDHSYSKRDPNGHRGILCRSCNRGIGLLKDDPIILRRAAAYIERHRDGQNKHSRTKGMGLLRATDNQ